MAKIENKRTISKKITLGGVLNAEEADNIVVENPAEGDQIVNSILAEFDGLGVKITIESTEENPLEPIEE